MKRGRLETNMPKSRRVALILNTNLPYQRKIIRGVVAYAHQAGDWSLYGPVRKYCNSSAC